MKTLSAKFDGWLESNPRKKEAKHPDFVGRVQAWGTSHVAAAWMAPTRREDVYIALRLTNDDLSQSEKIKLAIWRLRDRATKEDPHFLSSQEVYGHKFEFAAWILPSPAANGDADFRLRLTIEPAPVREETDAIRFTRQRIAEFLASERLAALPPPSRARLEQSQQPPLPVAQPTAEPDDIPS